MPLSPADQAWSDQYDQQQAAEAAKKAQEGQPKQDPSFLDVFGKSGVGPITLNGIDSAITKAEQWGQAAPEQAQRKGQDVVAGLAQGAAALVDTTNPAHAINASMPAGVPLHVTMPIWDHAKQAVLDFRDAVAVKDPTIADGITQNIAQLLPGYLGWSRALSELHGTANLVASGVVTDATMLDPHAPRLADTLSMIRSSEGKYGDLLRQMAPDGSLLNAYINYVAHNDKATEGEAEGRFKNVLDGAAATLIGAPVLHAIGVSIKAGTRGVNYALENGVRQSLGELLPSKPITPEPLPAAENVVPFRRKEEVLPTQSYEQYRQHIKQVAGVDLGPAVENNASGESVASLEAQNRPKRNLDIVDSEGRATPILKDVTQVDRQPPKGHIIVDRDTGGLVARGPDLTEAAGRRMLAVYHGRSVSLDELAPNFARVARENKLYGVPDDRASLAELDALTAKLGEK